MIPPETAGSGIEPGVVVAGLVVVQAVPEAKARKRLRQTAEARIVVFTLST